MKLCLDPGAYLPERAHKTDGGLDLKTPVDIMVPAGGSVTVNTGVHIALPKGTAGFLKSKSGLNVNYGIVSDGVIDEGYTGAIRAKLYNHGEHDVLIEKGQKITQLVILPILTPELELVSSLEETERGDNGFGSSGK